MTRAPPVIETSARVTMTIQISGLGSWGPECGIKQVHEQARQSAYGFIGRVIEKSGEGRITMIGEPTVTAVLVEKHP